MSMPELPSSSNLPVPDFVYTRTAVELPFKIISLPGRKEGIPYRFYENKRGEINRKLWKYLTKFLLSPDKYTYMLYWQNTKYRKFGIRLGNGKMWGAKCMNTNLENFSKVLSSYYKSKIFLPLNALPCPDKNENGEIWMVKPNPDVCEARSNNYKKRILLPLGKRLVYKFPNAIAWR